MSADYEDRLRRLALHDEALIEAMLETDRLPTERPSVDARTDALVRLGSLIATGAAPVSYQSCVQAALDAGATLAQVFGTLTAVAPLVGMARVVSAAPSIALAMGLDIEAALEALEEATP